MNLYDYLCKLRHKIFYLYACYHILSVYLSFHVILNYDKKCIILGLIVHNSNNIVLFPSIFQIIIGFS